MAFLTSDDGTVRRLRISPALVREAGGLRRFDRRRVAVSVPAVSVAAAIPGPNSASKALRPTGLRLLAAADGAVTQGGTPGVGADAAVTASYPWITLACKFADVAVEPKTISYFSGMYGDAAPGLDHYWRELSYDTADIAGSTAAGWFTLPRVRSAYIYDMDGDGVVDTDLDGLFDDCTAAATPSVDFRAYQGINMMFNSNLDGPAWGGALYATLDGVMKRWSVTWEPPWAYADISVIAHEMGHGFGLPHSSYGTSAPYDNAWDVMSKDR